MKRSEMINLIHDYTSTLRIINHDETIAEHILDMLEHNKMEPPAIKEPCQTHVINQFGQVLQTEDSFVYVNQWEPENGQCNRPDSTQEDKGSDQTCEGTPRTNDNTENLD